MAPLENLIRLHPLHINELPTHSTLQISASSSKPSSNGNHVSPTAANDRPQLLPFISEALDQALRFIEETLPTTFKTTGTKSSPPATGTVEVLKRDVSANEISNIQWSAPRAPRRISGATTSPKSGEAWFARRSQHEDQRTEGTATANEFDAGLRQEHSLHEMEYTPDVFDAYKVLDWVETMNKTLVGGASLGRYADVNMAMYEMCHELPAMLKNRVFPVLVITASTGIDELIVVQIPVDVRNSEAAFYSNERNLKEGDSEVKRKKSVLGVYTSIERCHRLPNGKIEWTMATASDAQGSLPMWAQKMGVPGAVVKDVGLFMGWIMRRRS